jgi:site-specific recombinase XerD
MEGSIDKFGKTINPSPKTINGFISTIKTLFSDEVNKAHIDRNPFAHIKNLKETKPRPEFYTVDELNNFFKVKMPDEYRNAFLGLFYTGVRFGELANVSWDDIDLNGKLMTIRAKENHSLKTNNAQRIIPIPQPLFVLLNDLSKNKKSELYVFCSIKGKQLNERKLLDACKRIGAKAGIVSRMFLHKFRHTYATMLVQRKIDITEIQKLMGHASILETMIYVHVKTEELHDSVNVLSNVITLENNVVDLPKKELPVFSMKNAEYFREESLRRLVDTALQLLKVAA